MTASLMRLVPRRLRFRAAIRIALWVAPLLTRMGHFPPGRLIADSPREFTLFRLLDLLGRYGCEFDPEIAFEGHEAVDRAVAARRGLLIVAPHALLTFLVARYLHDLGEPLLVLSGTPRYQILGTKERVWAMRARGSLLRVRTVLRKGGAVGTMIDRRGGSWKTEFTTDLGEWKVADDVLHLARRIGAEIVFVAFRLDGKTVRARAVTPPDDAAIEEIATAFAEFTREHVTATVR